MTFERYIIDNIIPFLRELERVRRDLTSHETQQKFVENYFRDHAEQLFKKSKNKRLTLHDLSSFKSFINGIAHRHIKESKEKRIATLLQEGTGCLSDTFLVAINWTRDGRDDVAAFDKESEVEDHDDDDDDDMVGDAIQVSAGKRKREGAREVEAMAKPINDTSRRETVRGSSPLSELPDDPSDTEYHEVEDSRSEDNFSDNEPAPPFPKRRAPARPSKVSSNAQTKGKHPLRTFHDPKRRDRKPFRPSPDPGQDASELQEGTLDSSNLTAESEQATVARNVTRQAQKTIASPNNDASLIQNPSLATNFPKNSTRHDFSLATKSSFTISQSVQLLNPELETSLNTIQIIVETTAHRLCEDLHLELEISSSHFPFYPIPALEALYRQIFGYNWKPAATALQAADRLERTSFLHALLSAFLARKIFHPDSRLPWNSPLDLLTLPAWSGVSQYLNTQVGEQWEQIVHQAALAQILDRKFQDPIVREAAAGLVQELMFTLDQHVALMRRSSPVIDGEWHHRFSKGVQELCFEALKLRARMLASQDQYELVWSKADAQFNGDEMRSVGEESPRAGARINLVTLPGFRCRPIGGLKPTYVASKARVVVHYDEADRE